MLPAAALSLALLAGLDVAPHRAPLVRPPECNLLPGERGSNVWERAKIPALRPYCDLLASASAKLAPGSKLVAEVVSLADKAETLVQGRSPPLLLKGRALAQLGRYPEALTVLREAKARDDRALDDPTALLAFARALEFTGDVTAARDAYRALLPRAESLPLADRGVAYLGAGMLAMLAGPDALTEAVAILRQARRDSQDVLRSAATFALALALDRAGEGGEAAAVLAEEGTGDATHVLTDARVLSAMGKSGETEAHAVLGLVLDMDGKHDAARAAWQAYLTSGADAGVWAVHAKAHGATRASSAPTSRQSAPANRSHS